jgi:putative effector of murein hydrolase
VAALVVIVLVIMVVAIMVVVVVGGGIVVRLPGRVLVGVFVFDVIVAMGVRVAQSGHALRVSRGPRLGSRPGRDWPAARRVLMRSLRSARQ